jgi:hypothetical protein
MGATIVNRRPVGIKRPVEEVCGPALPIKEQLGPLPPLVLDGGPICEGHAGVVAARPTAPHETVPRKGVGAGPTLRHWGASWSLACLTPRGIQRAVWIIHAMIEDVPVAAPARWEEQVGRDGGESQLGRDGGKSRWEEMAAKVS